MADYKFYNAFVLHQRAYRETSTIVDFFSGQYGHVRAVCRGVKGHGKAAARLRSIVQPFSELTVSWYGKTELKTVRQVEPLSPAKQMNQKQLYAGLYMNELTLRLARHDEDCSELYDAYKAAVDGLTSPRIPHGVNEAINIESVLRRFELQLLSSIGFELDFYNDTSSGQAIDAAMQYCYVADQGFIPLGVLAQKHSEHESIPGEVIIALQEKALSDVQVLRYAKYIMRQALAPHLGGKPLKARDLYR